MHNFKHVLRMYSLPIAPSNVLSSRNSYRTRRPIDHSPIALRGDDKKPKSSFCHRVTRATIVAFFSCLEALIIIGRLDARRAGPVSRYNKSRATTTTPYNVGHKPLPAFFFFFCYALMRLHAHILRLRPLSKATYLG